MANQANTPKAQANAPKAPIVDPQADDVEDIVDTVEDTVEEIITLNAFQAADITHAMGGVEKVYKTDNVDSPLYGKKFRTYLLDSVPFIVNSELNFDADLKAGNIFSVKLKKSVYEKKLKDQDGNETGKTETRDSYEFVSYVTLEKQKNLIAATKGMEFEEKSWDYKIKNIGKVESSAVTDDLLAKLLHAVNRQ